MLLLLAAAAQAGLQPSREPLPAREVERGIVLPLGWTEVGADGGARGVSLAARNGTARGLALAAAVDLDADGLAETRIAADLGLIWREPPAVAWAARLAWRQPWADAAAEAQGTLLIRRAFGPFRADAAAGYALAVDGATHPLADASLLLQLGPLWERVGAGIGDDGAAVWTATTALQLTRGVELHAGGRFDGGAGRFDAGFVAWL
jgi:hypothetical protein